MIQKLLILVALPLAAQVPPAVEACEKLRHHGDPSATACYEKLTRSTDREIQAEGYWGIRNYKSANDLFRDAVKAKPKDARLRVRWGYLYKDHWQEEDAGNLFQEAIELDPKNSQALVGLAQLAADGFSSRAVEFAKKALEIDPKAYQAEEVLAESS